MNIPFFPYSKLYEDHKKDFIDIFDDVCSRGAFILQKDLEEFEKSISEFVDAKHVFGVANGTDALIIGLRSCGIGEGDEVIVPSHTYIASPASIHFVGAKPILTELGADGMMDVKDIESRITKKTKAIMPVHINGRTCNMDAIREIADRNNLLIVEDAAQALGSRYKDQCAGTFGSFGTISLYPAKLLGCFGDGGLVLTNDDDIAQSVSLLRDHGRDKNGNVVSWGLNSRLDNIQAAFLNFKLKNYKKEIEIRRNLASFYNEKLSDIDELILPIQPSDGVHFDVYQNYELQAKDRDKLRAYLGENGIGTIVQWAGTPVHKFKKLGFDQVLPKTDKFFERCMMLPMNVAVSEAEADFIVSKIRDFYA